MGTCPACGADKTILVLKMAEAKKYDNKQKPCFCLSVLGHSNDVFYGQSPSDFTKVWSVYRGEFYLCCFEKRTPGSGLRPSDYTALSQVGWAVQLVCDIYNHLAPKR